MVRNFSIMEGWFSVLINSQGLKALDLKLTILSLVLIFRWSPGPKSLKS